MCRIVDLKCKEVINICDGSRLGFVCDCEIDICCGRIVSIIVPGPCWFFGLFGRGEDYIIPWDDIKRIGDDIILVEYVKKDEYSRKKRRKRRIF